MSEEMVRRRLMLSLTKLSAQEIEQLAQLLLKLEPTNMEVRGFILKLLRL